MTTHPDENGFKLAKHLISKGAITPKLLEDHKKLEAMRKNVRKGGFEQGHYAEIYDFNMVKAHTKLEAAKIFAAQEQIDADFPITDEILKDFDLIVESEANKMLRKMVA